MMSAASATGTVAKRPRGRAPRGKAWDSLVGQWIDASDSDTEPPAGWSSLPVHGSEAQQGAGGAEAMSLRDRKQTKRALERDVAAGAMELSDAALSDESDDVTYGDVTKAGPKRKRSGVLQLLKQSMPQMQLNTPMAPELYEPFVPLKDLKGGAPNTAVGRRICVWYEHAAEDDEPPVGLSAPQPSGPPQPQPQPGVTTEQHLPTEPARPELQGSTLKPAFGVVSYFCEAGRLHVVFDGDDEFDGW